MAAYLNIALPARYSAVLALLILAATASGAQTLRDPTRPPDAAPAASAATDGEAYVLQSILVSPKRQEAMIGGRVVRVGDRVREARVVAIRDSEVVLQEGNARRVLRLYPEIQKKAVAAPAASTTNDKK